MTFTSLFSRSSLPMKDAADTGTSAANYIIQDAGQQFREAVNFLIQPGNFKLAMGIALIFILVSVLLKGTEKVIGIIIEGLGMLILVYFVLTAFGVEMDPMTFLNNIIEMLKQFWIGVTGA